MVPENGARRRGAGIIRRRPCGDEGLDVSETTPRPTPVRPAHRFDERSLARYLRGRLSGFPAAGGAAAGLAVRQFEGGQSNPTFLLAAGEREYVLRKQPPGELLPSAHQVDREYRVMAALAETPVPVPRMFLLCEDLDVIGVKFYVMEKVEGRVYANPLMPGASARERAAVYRSLVDVLAALHAVAPAAVGLESFGRPGNYYERQIARWSKQYVASRTEDIPEMDALMEWLPRHVPAADETVVVHGDYRLGNAVVHPREPRIAAVLDWELSTLGHPLADLGYVCQTYYADEDDLHGLNRPNLGELGIPTEEEFVARYCERAGIKGIEDWRFYLVYNLFRSAAIIQGVYRRGLDGNASSDSALGFEGYCRARAARAWRLADTGS